MLGFRGLSPFEQLRPENLGSILPQYQRSVICKGQNLKPLWHLNLVYVQESYNNFEWWHTKAEDTVACVP